MTRDFRGRIFCCSHRRHSAAGRLFRAFGRPQVYRGKVFGSIFATISLFLFAFFAYEIFYVLRQVPISAQAPRVGEKAPEFSLPDQMASQWHWRSAFSQRSGPDFLSGALVTAM